MRIERIDERTVKCFLSNEELQEYEVSYKDFVLRSDKAREVVEDIIEQAEEEVGYQPPRFAFDLQIMMLPGSGMVLTFSERDPEADTPEKELADCLKNMRDIFSGGLEAQSQDGNKRLDSFLADLAKYGILGKVLGLGRQSGEAPQDGAEAYIADDGTESGDQEPEEDNRPSFAVFEFTSLKSVCDFARALPKDLGIISTLYCMDGRYYLSMDRGLLPYEVYSRACIQAIEFSSIYAASLDGMAHLMEHGECLIGRDALAKLKG